MFTTGLLGIICLTSIVSGYMSWNSTNVCCDGTIADYSKECCGSAPYDFNTTLCCNGKLFPLDEGQHSDDYDCCGEDTGKVYNIHTSVCCGGIITDGLPGINAANQFDCCEDPTTNKSTPYLWGISVCCNGLILEKENIYSDYGCCGSELIEYERRPYCGDIDIVFYDKRHYENYESKACCGGTKKYDPNEQVCASSYNEETGEDEFQTLDLENEFSSVCGLKLYDYRTQGCCVEDIYDTASSICCGEKVEPLKGQLYQCCYQDNIVYDTTTHFCGEEGVANLSLAVSEKYKGYIDLCGPSFPPNLPYHPMKEDEEDEYVYVAWNETHICCNGEVDVNTMECCSGTIIDPLTSVCCNGGSIPVPEDEDGSDYSCCPSVDSESKIYNYQTSLCCDGILFSDKSENEYGCCEETGYYAYDTQQCCSGVLHDIEDDTQNYECCGTELITVDYDDVNRMLCCGTEMYDPSEQICAQYYDEDNSEEVYTILEISDNHTQACNYDELYDTLTHGCCAGTTVYSLDSEICCSEEIANKTPFSECCWGDGNIYDVRTQSCEEDGVVELEDAKVEEYKRDLEKCPGFPPNFPINERIYFYD